VKINKVKSINNKFISESGAALITSILALLLATLIGFTLVSIGLSTWEISSNGVEQTEAFYISEAGLTHAIQLVKSAGTSEFTNILIAGDGTPGTGDELSTQPSANTAIPQAGLTFGKGRYIVSISDDPADTDGNPNADSNGRLVITSTGIGKEGATATTEAIIEISPAGTSFPGFLAAGNVKSANSATLLGPAATMQINGELKSSADICAEQKIVMGGNGSQANLGLLTTNPLCDVAAQSGSTLLLNQPPVAPPIIDTAKLRSDFRSKADYVFKSNGNIHKQTGGVQSVTPLSSAEITAIGFAPWTLGSKTTWIYNSPIAPPDGIFYFEESSVKFNHGDTSKTPKITLLSEGSIEIDDGQSFEPKLPGYSLVSANDISIVAELTNGNLTNPGLVYAYGQLEFANKCTIYGGVIGANFYQPDGTNGPDINDVGGANIAKGSDGAINIGNKTTIITSSALNWFTQPQTNFISWREVRY
jgi:hypothetical protein